MKITYLGTGGAEGFPSVFCECAACKKVRRLGGRNIKTRSCTLIDDVLVDISPDIFSQCAVRGLSLSPVNKIVMTHSHSDHLNTLEIRLRMREMASVLPADREKKLEIYGNRQVGQVIMKAASGDPHVDFSRMEFHEIHAFEQIKVNGLLFTALKANHKKDEESLIYAVNNETGSFLYANDTGVLPEETLEYIHSNHFCFDLVSMDSGRGTLSGDGHMGLSENIALRKRLEEMKAVHNDTGYYLNHFSHMCGMTPDEYQKLVENYGFQLTYDGMVLEMEEEGKYVDNKGCCSESGRDGNNSIESIK